MAVNGEASRKAPRVKGNRAWQRLLKNGRVEIYVALEGTFLHVIAEPGVAQRVLDTIREESGVEALPNIELRGKRRPARGPSPMPGQMHLEDG